ncbi:glycosyltransferase [Pseudonocardia sp. ICBG1293]|uniref:glycosyltransferase n=1 Tax=Pseudonocardia sp. ICBG1293 TaxID=2844382 RepID=UPI001CCFC1BD|nr:glycosyltransferase [Pseudonocardia sp. ICBG1293]
MRVLHVTQPTVAGVHRYVLGAAVDQLARGWDVHVACPPDGLLGRDLAAAGVPHVVWAAGRAPGLSVPREVRALRRVVSRLAPDVVHLHSAKAGLAGRLAVRGTVPTLHQPHGWSWLAVDGVQARAALRWERTAARWTTCVVACGEGEAAQGRAAGVPEPIAVVRNGVDLARFRPAGPDERRAARDTLGLPHDAPVAVCPGRFARQKGQDVLLAAWGAVRGRVPDARLVLVGGGDAGGTGAAVTGTPGLERFGPTTDISRFYAAADVVVLPSRWEGLSLSAIEALATGRPVVASAVPGLAELVPPAVGALVPPEDPGDLADAVADRLLDPGLAGREGRAAAGWARGFDTARTWTELAALTERTARVNARRAP